MTPPVGTAETPAEGAGATAPEARVAQAALNGSGGQMGTGGDHGSGGAIIHSPVTNECWFEELEPCGASAPGGAPGASCPVSADVEITCSVHYYDRTPVVLPTAEGYGLQMVFEAGLSEGPASRMQETHAQLQADGTISLLDLREGRDPELARLLVLGVDDATGALDLLDLFGDDLSVSEPFLPADGTPTWTTVHPTGRFFEGRVVRDDDGTLHFLVSAYNEMTLVYDYFYASGTAGAGFTVSAHDWSQVPRLLALTDAGQPVGIYTSESNPDRVVAEERGADPVTLGTFNDGASPLLVAQGHDTGQTAPDYFVIVATGEDQIFAVASPEVSVAPLLIPLSLDAGWSGDCAAEGCNGECTYEGSWASAWTAARTADGRVWVAARVVHEDTSTRYWVESEEDAYICGAGYDRDASTSELVLFEVDWEAGEARRVFSTEAVGLAPTDLNVNTHAWYANEDLILSAHGADLLLSYPVITPDRGRHPIRSLRVDTTLIPEN